MTLLTGALPEAVQVCGERVPVRTGYRVGMRFERLLWDGRAGDAARVALGLRLYYAPEDLGRGLDAGALFAAAVGFFGGWTRDGEGLPEGARGHAARLYDWEKDGAAVFASLWAAYGVDMRREPDMHWWVFRALVQGLGPDSAFMRRVAVRAADLSAVEGSARAELAGRKRLLRLDGGGRELTIDNFSYWRGRGVRVDRGKAR